MHLQFVNGWVLFLIWVAPAVAFLWIIIFRKKQTALASFLAEPMLSKLAPSIKPFRFYWQLAFIQTGLVLVIIAAARPQWGTEEKTVFQRGRDLIIALDVSRSMLARDVHPSRLQRAKADIQDLLRELRGDRVALFTFRGKAVQLCPLTTDYAYLEQILDGVTVDSAPRGETNIGDAIDKALAAFETDQGSHRAMILISDGEDLAGQAKAAAEMAKTKGVVVFTVGLGDSKGATIPDAAKGDSAMTYQGKEIISKLQHETLKTIADITGGAYVPVGVANVKLGRLYSEHLSKISERDIEESLQRRMVERYQLFLFPGALLLIAGALLSRGRLATRGRTSSSSQSSELNLNAALKRNICIAWLLLYSFVQFAFATTNQIPAAPERNGRDEARPSTPITGSNDYLVKGHALASAKHPAETGSSYPQPGNGVIFASGRAGACKAQQYYRLGAYEKSASAYLHAMSNCSQRLQNDCIFNAGCASYRAGNYPGALESFNQLANRENTDQSKVYYNSGCATFHMAEDSGKPDTNHPPEMKPVLLEKAGNAFQRSLRIKPDFQNASANLAVITNMLPKARKEAKLQTLMARYGKQPPGQLADTILANQRNILKDLPAALTNTAPGRISQFESLAEKQSINTDLVLPLKFTLLNAIASQGQTNQQQIARAGQHLEAVQNSMNEAFETLRNIDNNSFRPVAAAERGVYNLWKNLADFQQLLQEDIRRQTNAIDMSTSILAKADLPGVALAKTEQNEAQQLTGLFTERFAEAVPPEGTPVSGKLPGAPAAPLPAEGTETPSTNDAPQITREMRTNILFFAEQAVKTQARACQLISATNIAASLPEQRQSYNLLKEIEKLLPKNKNQQNDRQNQDQQKQQKDQKQDKEQNKDKNDNQQPPPENEQEPPPPQQEEKPQQPKEQSEQKDQKEMTPEQLRALLDNALQREKDHREEKTRDEYMPPSPIERDW